LAARNSEDTRRAPKTEARMTGIASTATTLRRTDHSETWKTERKAPRGASSRLFDNGTPDFRTSPHRRPEASDGRADGARRCHDRYRKRPPTGVLAKNAAKLPQRPRGAWPGWTSPPSQAPS